MAGPRKFEKHSLAYRQYKALKRLPPACPPYSYAASGYPQVQQHELYCRQPGTDGQLCGYYKHNDIGYLWNHLEKKHGFQRQNRPSFQSLTWSEERFNELNLFYTELMKAMKEGGEHAKQGLRRSGRDQRPAYGTYSKDDEDDEEPAIMQKREAGSQRHESVKIQRPMQRKHSRIVDEQDVEMSTQEAMLATNGMTAKRKRDIDGEVSEYDEASLQAQLKEKKAKQEMKAAALEVKEAAFEVAELEAKLAVRKNK
ncbi:hypothetical protein DOTSEDRAFT_26409 [Dothistroma septosporum NZE10]|uniref:Uncharacterized protein n=1 Tax=Dothistroma septosporum (strain NZE10 / CBS 128990) TaxID=675120 RepID=N1PFU2_DOTSN|nr:hypothetical protein DOTSEDRAFT_26409 [Dothistroma septosporum NZE10]